MCKEVEKYLPSSTSGFSHHDLRKSEVDGKGGENDHPAADLFYDIWNVYCIYIIMSGVCVSVCHYSNVQKLSSFEAMGYPWVPMASL